VPLTLVAALWVRVMHEARVLRARSAWRRARPGGGRG
jgi:hypothetical protein